jgi:hypothetical protein
LKGLDVGFIPHILFLTGGKKMAIRSAEELVTDKVQIDLTGSHGNAFVLLGTAKRYAETLGKDADDILKRMKSGDYENLIKVFDEEFGDYVDLFR